MTSGAARRPLVVAWLAALFGAGCFAPNAVTCSDGTVCAAGTGCDVLKHVCVPAGQVQACAGRAEAAACTATGKDGTCRSGVCRTPECGDGVRNNGEQCDGNDVGGQDCTSLHFQGGYGVYCTSNCTLDTSLCVGSPGYCGDGIKGLTEQCDGDDLGGATCATSGTYFDPVSNGRLACTASCTFDLSACGLSCGDGLITGGEDCDGAPPAGKSCVDYGFDRGLLGCSADCTPALEGCGQLGWQSTSPSGALPALNAVWENGPDDIFAVGDGGAIVRGTGGTWRAMTSNTTLPLVGVWGSGARDVYAVGGDGLTGVVCHWDGSQWSALGLGSPSPSNLPRAIAAASSVWGSGPDDVYIVGPDVVLHFDGRAWAVVPFDAAPHGFSGVWESGPGDVFVADSVQGIHHWNGTSWLSTGEPAAFGIWGSGPNDVFALGNHAVDRWDGIGWSPWASTLGQPRAIAWSGSGDVFVVVDDALWHMRRGQLEKLGLPVAGSVRGLWVNPGRVDLVGSMGVVQLVLDSVTCAGQELCGDGWDNDCDGLQDAADPDCIGKVAEQCANLVDDDGDGKTDCGDPDCASFPSCKVRR